MAETIQAINEQISAATMSSIAPIVGALATIKQDLALPILDITNNLYSALSVLYGTNETSDLLDEAEETTELTEPENGEESEEPKTPEEPEDNS